MQTARPQSLDEIIAKQKQEEVNRPWRPRSIPSTERSLAWRIFNVQWKCTLPEMYFYGKDFLEQNGFPTTGDRAMDKELMEASRVRYMSIAAMAVFIDQGANVGIVNISDTLPIYRMVTEHMSNWWWIINHYRNIKAPPAEDFEMFDTLAKLLYPYAEGVQAGAPKIGFFAKIAKLQGKHTPLLAHAPHRSAQIAADRAIMEILGPNHEENQSLGERIATRLHRWQNPTGEKRPKE